MRCNEEKLVVQVHKKNEPLKQSLLYFNLVDLDPSLSSFNSKPVLEQAIDSPIVDFCFNAENSTLFVCRADGVVEIRNGIEDVFTVTYKVQLPANTKVREIICFNNLTLLLALTSKHVISVHQNNQKNGFEFKIKSLEHSIKNLVAVDNCIIAQQIDEQG
jgi:WD40 repeat protein